MIDGLQADVVTLALAYDIDAIAEQAQLLQVTTATPLLSVERIAYTYNDVPMELRRGLYRTDTHHYRNELS